MQLFALVVAFLVFAICYWMAGNFKSSTKSVNPDSAMVPLVPRFGADGLATGSGVGSPSDVPESAFSDFTDTSLNPESSTEILPRRRSDLERRKDRRRGKDRDDLGVVSEDSERSRGRDRERDRRRTRSEDRFDVGQDSEGESESSRSRDRERRRHRERGRERERDRDLEQDRDHASRPDRDRRRVRETGANEQPNPEPKSQSALPERKETPSSFPQSANPQKTLKGILKPPSTAIDRDKEEAAMHDKIKEEKTRSKVEKEEAIDPELLDKGKTARIGAGKGDDEYVDMRLFVDDRDETNSWNGNPQAFHAYQGRLKGTDLENDIPLTHSPLYREVEPGVKLKQKLEDGDFERKKQRMQISAHIIDMEGLCEEDYLNPNTADQHRKTARADDWHRMWGLIPLTVSDLINEILENQVMNMDILIKALKSTPYIVQHRNFPLGYIWEKHPTENQIHKDALLAFFMLPYRGYRYPSPEEEKRYSSTTNECWPVHLLEGAVDSITAGLLHWLVYIGRRFLILRMFSTGGADVADSTMRVSVNWLPKEKPPLYRMDVTLYTAEPKESTPVKDVRTPYWLRTDGPALGIIRHVRRLAETWVYSMRPGGGETTERTAKVSRRLWISPGWSIATIRKLGLGASEGTTPMLRRADRPAKRALIDQKDIDQTWIHKSDREGRAFREIFIALGTSSVSWVNRRQCSWHVVSDGKNEHFDDETISLLWMLCGYALNPQSKGHQSESDHPQMTQFLNNLDLGGVVPIDTSVHNRPRFPPLRQFPKLESVSLPYLTLEAMPSTAQLLVDSRWNLFSQLALRKPRLKVRLFLDRAGDKASLQSDLDAVLYDQVGFWKSEQAADNGLHSEDADLSLFLHNKILSVMNVLKFNVSVICRREDGSVDEEGIQFRIRDIDHWLWQRSER